MDAATARLVQGFLQLNQSQRNDFVNEINDFITERKTYASIFTESERVLRVNTGPVLGVCSWCGR
ncbi:hypothetical protein AB0I90_01315 [Micromonospora wenchangensis]|uniref:hypothetical protein n=1 Tax=Micromonospora wenchangensis TaxID=1185415 RepID=UPI0033D82405